MQIDRQQKTVDAIRMLVEPGKGSVASTKHDYKANSPGEISFTKGQRVMVTLLSNMTLEINFLATRKTGRRRLGARANRGWKRSFISN